MVGRWSLVERKMVPENSRKLLTTRSVGGPQWSVLSHSRDGRHLIAGFSKTWQLTPKQPWWMNSTSGKRNNMYFDFGGNCPFNPTGACPIFTYQSEESMSACQGLKQFWSFFFLFPGNYHPHPGHWHGPTRRDTRLLQTKSGQLWLHQWGACDMCMYTRLVRSRCISSLLYCTCEMWPQHKRAFICWVCCSQQEPNRLY